MKRTLAGLMVVVALGTGVASAASGGKRTLCNQPTAQSETGGGFYSFEECMAARVVFAPTMTLSGFTAPGQPFTARGDGFHKSTGGTFEIVATSHTFRSFTSVRTDKRGAFTFTLSIPDCDPGYLWYRDAFGVGAVVDTSDVCP